MRKTTIVISLILIFITTVIIIVRQNYSLSEEYNFVTAKFDIKDGNCRIVTIGGDMDSSKEAQTIAAKYGFKNTYVEKATPNELKGIKRYNETIEMFLSIRNGQSWRYRYQKEMDSLAGVIVPPVGIEK